MRCGVDRREVAEIGFGVGVRLGHFGESGRLKEPIKAAELGGAFEVTHWHVADDVFNECACYATIAQLRSDDDAGKAFHFVVEFLCVRDVRPCLVTVVGEDVAALAVHVWVTQQCDGRWVVELRMRQNVDTVTRCGVASRVMQLLQLRPVLWCAGPVVQLVHERARGRSA